MELIRQVSVRDSQFRVLSEEFVCGWWEKGKEISRLCVLFMLPDAAINIQVR